MEQNRRLENLQGKTLFTIKQHKAFTIVNVLVDRVEILPKAGKGKVRWVHRQEIERLINLKIKSGDLDVARVCEEFPESRNTSYLAAIVNELTRASES